MKIENFKRKMIYALQQYRYFFKLTPLATHDNIVNIYGKQAKESKMILPLSHI